MTVNGRKRKNTLSSRQKEIIRILIEMESETTTVAAISEQIGVSTRTVLREMPAVEQWLLENDFNFSRKHGVGLSIQETPEHLDLIRELLELEGVCKEFVAQRLGLECGGSGEGDSAASAVNLDNLVKDGKLEGWEGLVEEFAHARYGGGKRDGFENRETWKTAMKLMGISEED
jgi:hypothetical protein